LTGRQIDLQQVAEAAARHFSEVFGRDLKLSI
jgi:hypothetical protein